MAPRAADLPRKGVCWDCKLRNNYDRQFGRQAAGSECDSRDQCRDNLTALTLPVSISVDIVGGKILLVEALASTSPSISVIPAIGNGGEEGIDKVVDGQRDTEVECEVAVWC